MTFAEQLRKMNACTNAVEWVGTRTLEQAWKECERSDWMLWLLQKVGVDKRRCAGLFALRVWHLVPADSQLAAAWAIDCALRGAERDECDASYDASYDAAFAASSSSAASSAAAAANAAYAAAVNAAAYTIAAYAADAAYDAAAYDAADADAAYDAAERRAQRDIIREEIPLSVVRDALKMRMT